MRFKSFILLEVDTSDNATRLSTQLLTIKDMNSWEEDYEKIRKFVVQKTLNWPNSFIQKIATQQVRFNHHVLMRGSKSLLKT